MKFGGLLAVGVLSLGMGRVQGESLEPEPSGDPVELPALSVIAHAGARPLSVELDPKAPAQPIPAQDGAEVLRAIPGFNVIRKGGTDGDPVLRGMAGSRLGILIDGDEVLGGCGMRMDPPTAYVFPSAHDRVTVLKGPQTVRYGTGHSAGVVLFERTARRFEVPGVEGSGSLTAGAFDRLDSTLDLRGGGAAGQGQLAATWSESGDYEDGAGRRVASAYERWSLHGAIGWNPDTDSLVEVTGTLSDAQAAYADRGMDGVVFEREHLGLRFRKTFDSGWLKEAEGRVSWNDIDHVMDNFSLRPFSPTPMMPRPTVSNPDRETHSVRVEATLEPAARFEVLTGMDYRFNRHTLRRTSNQTLNPYQALPRRKDAEFTHAGLFAEAAWEPKEGSRLIGGLRLDFEEAEDFRPTVAVGMARQPNPTAGMRRSESLPAGFLRYERDLDEDLTVYAGVGHARRFPDYWELFNKESASSISSFNTSVEKTTQVDIGFTRRKGALLLSLSAFASEIRDFILIESRFAKPAMNGTRPATVVRSVDARTWGGEGTLSYRLGGAWLAEASLAWVHGTNRTENRPLAQQPPLEGRLSLRYQRQYWSAGAVWRLVDNQDRFARNQGNIVGQDLGPTPGFGILSLNASWRPARWNRITVGIDNLFNKTYAEHLSRAGSLIAGFPPPTTRVHEPGRSWWIAWNLHY
jgi:iron complex outermembrane receptor protein